MVFIFGYQDTELQKMFKDVIIYYYINACIHL